MGQTRAGFVAKKAQNVTFITGGNGVHYAYVGPYQLMKMDIRACQPTVTALNGNGLITTALNGNVPFNRRLKGKVALITGGARGIGGATAQLFAKHGAYVVIADILDDSGARLAESISGRYVHCDVSKEEDVESAVQVAIRWKGKLDVVFANAGIGGPAGSITDLKMDDVASVLGINLFGIIHAIKYASRAMIAVKTRGSIICSSSSAAIMGGLASHPYTLSKSAIIGLMKTTACELGVHGIRVNCISPHGVPSEMLLDAWKTCLKRDDIVAEDVTKIVGERASLLKGKGGSLDDVAQGVLFLASDESAFITAHNLVLDGGYTSAVSQMSGIY